MEAPRSCPLVLTRVAIMVSIFWSTLSPAARTARIALAAARRNARGTVLAAQRRAYDAVRSGMLAQLPARADVAVDRELAHDGERIEALWT